MSFYIPAFLYFAHTACCIPYRYRQTEMYQMTVR